MIPVRLRRLQALSVFLLLAHTACQATIFSKVDENKICPATTSTNDAGAATAAASSDFSSSTTRKVEDEPRSPLNEEQCESPILNNDTVKPQQQLAVNYSVPKDCTLVLAQSTLAESNSGWGVFTLVHRRRGEPVMYGDVVIQLTDLNVSTAASMKTMLNDYLWSAQETGGFYEGQTVASVLPGIGMIANGLPAPFHNVLPFVPQVDEGGLTRIDSPGAGSITHYHNYTFFAQKDIVAGSEIFVNYGSNWFQERLHLLQMTYSKNTDSNTSITTRSVDWLRQHGMCLDNLRPVPRSRLQPQAGRSVVATRSLPKGSLIAPVPVLPLYRKALHLSRPKLDGTAVELQQLLLNYCIGHENSSLLLFPYGPMVNLINHAGDELHLVNARLQWSMHQSRDVLERSLADLDSSPLMLDLVALRDIVEGEEILIDYGENWTAAWKNHVSNWQPPPNAAKYAPSYVHDDAIRSLRLESELKTHPYPDNIFTSCFYRYSDHTKENQKKQSSATTAGGGGGCDDAVVTVPWKQTRGIFELSNLRPCNVLQREHRGGKEGTVFTVQIRNRPHLSPEEVIPKGTIHIVTRVPRNAIRFSDKLYSTDQHLESAFRHEINSLNDGYPAQWLDLSCS